MEINRKQIMEILKSGASFKAELIVDCMDCSDIEIKFNLEYSEENGLDYYGSNKIFENDFVDAEDLIKSARYIELIEYKKA